MKFRFHSLGARASGFFNALILVAAFGVAILLLPQNGGEISGFGRASDGDSLRIGGERIRILGIDAPELNQNCLTKDGQEWPCGRVSRDKMASLIKGEKITCESDARDKYGRMLARCRVKGRDIAKIMISAGLAVSYNDYRQEEARARADEKGIWAGDFVYPRQWRDGQREIPHSSGTAGDFWAWITGWFS